MRELLFGGSAGRALALLALLALLAGCGSVELPPCDAPERRAQAREVKHMPAAVRDSIARAFTGRNRIQQVDIEQQDCHFRATVRIDSFATPSYASVQGIALLRALKEHAPHETRPLVKEDPAGEVGVGLYDYVVVLEQQGDEEAKAPGERKQTPWVHISKPYNDRRVTVRR